MICFFVLLFKMVVFEIVIFDFFVFIGCWCVCNDFVVNVRGVCSELMSLIVLVIRFYYNFFIGISEVWNCFELLFLWFRGIGF